MSISHTFLHGLGLIACFQIAGAATTTHGSLPGEYRRSFDLEAAIGVKVTLQADGSFNASASGNVAKTPQTRIEEGEIGSASGNWEFSNDEVRLVPTACSGVLAKRYLKYRVEQCAGVPALLPADELTTEGAPAPTVGVPQSTFVRLLLKERVVRGAPSEPNERKVDEQNWADVANALLDADAGNSARFIGKIVSFRGERANVFDTAELKVVVRISGSPILCRVRNNIDGTRLAESWTAGMVGVWVRGEIVKIDQAARSVEIQPLEASPTWAR